MAFRKKSARRDFRSLCGDVGPEDGVDPRKFFDRDEASRNTGRKARQLCGQVARTLSYAISETGDEVLGRLDVVSVEPAPDATQLMVTVALFPGSEPIAVETILARLAQAGGRLRVKVAGAITRRRAPRLMFRVGTHEGERPEGGRP